MSSLEFLRPWIDILTKYAALDEYSPGCYGCAVHECGEQPIGPIRVQFSEDFSHQEMLKLHQAMELMGRGLLIDQKLWSSIPLKVLDPRRFRPAQLKPSFRIKGSPEKLQCVARLLSSRAEDTDPAFEFASQKLQVFDVYDIAPVGQYQVPVSLRLQRTSSAIVTMLEAVTSSSSPSCPPAFRLTHVDVATDMMDDEMHMMIARIQACGIPVRHLGVAHCHAVDVFSRNVFRSVVDQSSSLASPIQSLSLGFFGFVIDIQGGHCAAVLNGPSHVRIRMPVSQMPDWLMLCRALQLSTSRPGTRSFSIALPNLLPPRASLWKRALHMIETSSSPTTAVRVNTATATGARLLAQLASKSINGSASLPAIVGSRSVLLLVPNSSEMVEVPRTSVMVVDANNATETETFTPAVDCDISVRLTTGLCTSTSLPTVIYFLGTIFGARLTSLDVDFVIDATFSASTIATMLAAFPSLTRLKLRPTELQTMDVFLDAYREGKCQLHTLSIDCGHIGFVPFFEELASPNAIVTQTLRDLKIGFPTGDADDAGGDAFLQALVTMLEHNQLLRDFELVVATKSQPLIVKVASALRPLHRSPISVASREPMPMKAKIAALAAITHASDERPTKQRRLAAAPGLAHSRLDRGPLALILSFAAPCELRMLCLVHEKSRIVGRGKVSGGDMAFATVKRELVPL